MMETLTIIVVAIIILYTILLIIGYSLSFLFCHYYAKKALLTKGKSSNESGHLIQRTTNNKYRQVTSLKHNIKSFFMNGFVSGLIHYLCLRVGRIPSFAIRRILYKNIFCMQIEKRTIIYGGCEFRSPWNIRIGESVIGANSILDGRGGIIIGNHVCISSQINIWTMQHDSQDSCFGVDTGSVIIEDYAWVSSKSTLLPGRMVGKGAVVANSAVVTKNCESFGIYAGIPAHKIGDRNTNIDYELDTHWWFM